MSDKFPDVKKFCQHTGYSVSQQWHPVEQEWQVVIRDKSGAIVTSDWDANLSTATGVAMLKCFVQPPEK